MSTSTPSTKSAGKAASKADKAVVQTDKAVVRADKAADKTDKPAAKTEKAKASKSAAKAAAESSSREAPPSKAPAAKARPSADAAPPSDSYAIVEACGQQFWLQPNRYLDLDRLDAAVDSTVKLDTVLLVHDSKGTRIGQPYVKGASVELKVMAHRRGPKLIVYKMRPKKKTRRKNGHRQELTRVMVQSIKG